MSAFLVNRQFFEFETRSFYLCLESRIRFSLNLFLKPRQHGQKPRFFLVPKVNVK